MAAHPRPSAAVILMRPHGSDEVFLVQRSKELSFLGGYWAFPGGVVDPEDERGGGMEETLARCALRELFEETGVQLEGRASLRRICEFTTPEFLPRRYSTTFFDADMPSGAEPRVAGGEVVNGRFWRPTEALAAWRKGELLIAPPVLRLLELFVPQDREMFRAGARREAERLDAGALHLVRFSPGICVVPLRTPTLPPATTTNCLLVGEERVYILDPATYEPSERQRLFDLLDAWRTSGRILQGVLLSHHHADHVGSAGAVCARYGLPVWAHELTLSRLELGGAPAHALAEGDAIDLGRTPDGQAGWTLRVLHTPGHDRGHLAFIESRYGALLAGDLVSTLSTIVIDPPEGHLRTYLQTLTRLLSEPIHMLYPAHGPPHNDARMLLKQYLAHRARREAKLIGALAAAPQSEAELLPSVYDDIASDLHPLALRSLFAGLEKLAEDGIASRVEDGWSRSG